MHNCKALPFNFLNPTPVLRVKQNWPAFVKCNVLTGVIVFLLSAPVISITDTDGDVAENGRELHSDSKVCATFFMMLSALTSQ